MKEPARTATLSRPTAQGLYTSAPSPRSPTPSEPQNLAPASLYASPPSARRSHAEAAGALTTHSPLPPPDPEALPRPANRETVP
jgi:hypothetical protein